MQRCLLLSLNSLNNIQKDTWLGGWLETDRWTDILTDRRKEGRICGQIDR
jgi:hypothetical protein